MEPVLDRAELDGARPPEGHVMRDARKGKPTKRPNIVMILTDDQGIWSLGCYGNPEIRTPNIDRLAESGARFDNFFCVSPVCSPARASLLTGKIPSQHGIHDYLSGGNGGAGQKAIEFLKDHRGYTDLLAEQGYTCGLSGKWHLGDGLHPQKGFSFWYAHQKGGGPYYHAPMIRDGKMVEEEGYITDVITDEALAFLDRQKGADHPFYLSVHYTAPHSPWIGCHPKKYTDLYEDCRFDSCPQRETPHPWAKVGQVEGYTRPRECLIGYFAAVTAMDDNVGRILKKLEDENWMDDTLIIFTSDNGFNCGHHGIWGKGNGTFPLNMYDSSVKVPFLMSHRGHIPDHSVCGELCSGYDFMPVLLDYLGLSDEGCQGLPGHSFLPALMRGRQMPKEQTQAVQERDEKTRGGQTQEQIAGQEQYEQTPAGRPREDEERGGREVVVFDEYGPVRMIRTDEYKYIHRYPYGPDEFYDLKHDPGEEENRIEDADFQPVIRDMKRRMDLWFLKYADARIDGAKEAVMGGGQKDLAGVLGPGVSVYGENK